jgi:hypothetical protein
MNIDVALPDVTDPDPPVIFIELNIPVSPVIESGIELLEIVLTLAVMVIVPALLPVAIPLEDIVAVPLPPVAIHVNVGVGEIVLP